MGNIPYLGDLDEPEDLADDALNKQNAMANSGQVAMGSESSGAGSARGQEHSEKLLICLSGEIGSLHDELSALEKRLDGLKEDVAQNAGKLDYLSDLFTRRLQNDRQKKALIDKLSDQADFAFIEPFLQDLILVVDRARREARQTRSVFAESVAEEVEGVLERRGVSKIQVREEFDPHLYKAVRREEWAGIEQRRVVGIVRDGYLLGERVVRPAEVIVAVPAKTSKRITSSIHGVDKQ